MDTDLKQKNIEGLFSDVDELLNQLNSGLIEDMEENKRNKHEIYANELKKKRLEARTVTEKGKTSDYSSSSEGMHEAIDDIVTAMKSLKSGLN
jgi:hypothetical protein